MQEGKKHLEYYLDRASSESDFAQFEKIAQEGFLSSMAAWENENISLIDLKNYNDEKEKAEEKFSEELQKGYVKWFTNNHLEKIIMKTNDEFKNEIKKLNSEEENSEILKKEITNLVEDFSKRTEAKLEEEKENIFYELTNLKLNENEIIKTLRECTDEIKTNSNNGIKIIHQL
jgi:hypothetical protein